MNCSVFIATSVDGYIAAEDGTVDWLYAAGDQQADLGDDVGMGFQQYIASVDCMIMGRGCMEILAGMRLTPEAWPYGNLRVIVLSRSINEPPAALPGPVEIYSGNIPTLIKSLESDGFKHAYVDGGATITSFLSLGLINEMTITKAPIILGKGIPLFGQLSQAINLEKTTAKVFTNGFIQETFVVSTD